jgi:hypothetical protein
MRKGAGSYFRGNYGQPLVDWLNVRRHDPAREAVRRLIGSFKKLKGEAEGQVNALLGRCTYQYSVVVGHMAHETVPAFRMDPVGEGSPSEHRAVTQIVHLYDQGLLGRVACCRGCGTWFFGRRADQRFCALKCKQASHEYLEYQRTKQKEYYDRNNKK